MPHSTSARWWTTLPRCRGAVGQCTARQLAQSINPSTDHSITRYHHRHHRRRDRPPLAISTDVASPSLLPLPQLSGPSTGNARATVASPSLLQMAARMLRLALPGAASTPGSASADPHSTRGYQGSRRERQRFAYSDTSKAGFVELAPRMHPTPQDRMTERRRGKPPGGRQGTRAEGLYKAL